MPSSRQARMTRTAISPRLATRILENIRPPLVVGGTEIQQRLVVLDHLAIRRVDREDPAAAGRGHRGEQLHRLDDGDLLPDLDHRTDLDERQLTGTGATVEGTDEWRAYLHRARVGDDRRGRPADRHRGAVDRAVDPVRALGLGYRLGWRRRVDVPVDLDQAVADPQADPAYRAGQPLDQRVRGGAQLPYPAQPVAVAHHP